MSRRIVTGLNAQGKSCVIIDAPLRANAGGGGIVWHTPTLPADNSGAADTADAPFSFESIQSGGSTFLVMEYPPNMAAHWHATDTIDYIAMLSGEITLELESGEATLRAGDVLVDRGIAHSWRNDSGAPARAAIIMLPAHPVGAGSAA
jgi:quercetin dioxygenase-like cupin family protein